MPTRKSKPRVPPQELSQLALSEALKPLPEWTLVARPNSRAEAGQTAELHRKFTFESFEDAMHFMGKAAKRITLMNHHPEWLNRYKAVSVWLTTWEAGGKPTLRDIDLAVHLDKLYNDSMAGRTGKN